MNAIHLAQSAYGSPASPLRTPRSVEYDLFARITQRLRSAHQQGRPGFSALARALHDNRRLWTTLAADLARPDNGLPATLRARLLYLAQFTLSHSSKVLAGEASAEVLVDVNTAVMGGLRGTVADAGEDPVADPGAGDPALPAAAPGGAAR
ncbi:flagellar biosynthesis regulator FlaF [Frigidibacter oleivorans]|uniref:flagellar biosynthesis regulator FlaF n=1 Tax=Frigidibacter oleivorans TaxID=2487129 RepID=UPI000F8F7F0C|nr:flagellar biosynthesis regulator FlaF [Frigidibacter oleivorans]